MQEIIHIPTRIWPYGWIPNTCQNSNNETRKHKHKAYVLFRGTYICDSYNEKNNEEKCRHILTLLIVYLENVICIKLI